MRRFWQAGTIGSETLICAEGDREWDAARLFPEITSVEPRLPNEVQSDQRRPMLSIGVWLLILFCAIYMWAMYQIFGR
jgi:hypothetical protein